MLSQAGTTLCHDGRLQTIYFIRYININIIDINAYMNNAGLLIPTYDLDLGRVVVFTFIWILHDLFVESNM